MTESSSQVIDLAWQIENRGYERGFESGYITGIKKGIESRNDEVTQERVYKKLLARLVAQLGGVVEIKIGDHGAVPKPLPAVVYEPPHFNIDGDGILEKSDFDARMVTVRTVER